MRTRLGRTFVALVLAAPLIAVMAPSTPIAAADPVCELGNGIQHVVEITFDNVHFFRDNPNMPSDLELMPHLSGFACRQIAERQASGGSAGEGERRRRYREDHGHAAVAQHQAGDHADEDA
jgi:hypothetical protein